MFGPWVTNGAGFSMRLKIDRIIPPAPEYEVIEEQFDHMMQHVHGQGHCGDYFAGENPTCSVCRAWRLTRKALLRIFEEPRK